MYHDIRTRLGLRGSADADDPTVGEAAKLRRQKEFPTWDITEAATISVTERLTTK
jgi:hypothetical protein